MGIRIGNLHGRGVEDKSSSSIINSWGKRAKAALALGGATLIALAASTATAFAAPVHICEVSGLYCVGAPSLADGAIVQETFGGRNINEDKLSNGLYKLKFTDNTSLCVAVNGADNTTVIKDCGDTNTEWDKQKDPHGNIFWNNVGPVLYLTGNNNGTQMSVDFFKCSPNCFQAFDN